MIPVAIAFAAGSAAALCLAFEQRLIVAIVLGLLCAWSFMERRATVRLRALIVLALACGFLYARSHGEASPNINQTHTSRYNVTVLSCAEVPGSPGAQCTLRSGAARVLAYFAHAPRVAHRIVVRARMTAFDSPRNPGEPDERLIQRERGLAARLEEAVVLEDLGPAPLDFDVGAARVQSISAARLREYLAEPYASIVAGELWGERAALPSDLRAEFQDSGTVHVLVTAGLHLGVVALLVVTCLAWLPLPRGYCCLLAVCTIWLYVAFSGAHLPAIRAGTMISFALAARAAGAKALSWNALASAGIVVLILSPASILSASFAMSFSCAGSIVLLCPHIERLMERTDAFPARVTEALTLTLATQAGVWPVTASTFLLFSPYAIIANATVVPVVGATMLLGGLQILFAPVSPCAHAFANLNAWLLTWMVSMIRLTASLPHAHVVMTPPPLWSVALYDGALFVTVWLAEKGARTVAAAVMIFAVFNIIAPPQFSTRELRITMLDVGQADAIVIRTPAGHVLLVDAGGRLERGARTAVDSAAEHIGETIVVPFLIRSGIHHVDVLLLSHPHGDHAGGIAPVLRGLGADEFADSGQQYGGFAYRDAISVARAEGTPIAYPRAGAVWRTNDGVTLTFLGPEMPFITRSRNDINNNSLVFMLAYKSFRMLFTGDAGAEAEQRISSEGVDLHATVLKVGHHGSAYSSTPEFIAAVHPKYAVISVGRHNLFGHPAPSTIATLQRSETQVYRTDENGAVTVITDGTSVSIKPLIPNSP
jgi:competence protein ComEC